MNIVSKVTWIMGLLCSFFLIMISGRANVKNFEKVQQAIEEIYKDRLVVKGIIFDLSRYLHQKETAIISKDKSYYQSEDQSTNAQIAESLYAFRSTVLTENEKETLNRFSSNLEELQKSEKESILLDNFTITNREIKIFQKKFSRLYQDLKILSEIQLSEGKRKVSVSDFAVESMNKSKEGENYILLIYAILMTVIIFVIPTKPFHEPESSESINS